MATTPNETEPPTVTVTAPALKPNREITGPFGSSVNTAIPEVTDHALSGGAVQADGTRVAVTDETVKGDKGFSEARQARDARAQREDSGILVGIGAAINTWDTTRLVKRLVTTLISHFDAGDPWLNERLFYNETLASFLRSQTLQKALGRLPDGLSAEGIPDLRRAR